MLRREYGRDESRDRCWEGPLERESQACIWLVVLHFLRNAEQATEYLSLQSSESL